MNHSTSHSSTSARWAACAAGCLLISVYMNAQIDRSRPPTPGPAPTVLLGEHSTAELPNGMKVIVVEDHKLPLVSVQLRFDVPPIAQREKTGYIDLVGDMLLAGTTTRNKAQIDLAVDAIGATFQASNNGVYASAMKKHLAPLMDLMQDVVINPTFPKEELEILRKRAISGVQQRHEDPDGIAEAVGRSVTFGSTHAYGEVTTVETLRAITTDAIAAYHDYFLRPENAYLVFVGDITVKEAKEIAKDLFGKWKPGAVAVDVNDKGIKSVKGIGQLFPLEKPSIPVGTRRIFMVDRPGAAQSVIRVGFGLNLQPKDIRAQQAQVMNTILGGGVFNARLMQNLREKRAFTYGAYSSLDVDRFNSSLTISVSVRTAVTDSAVKEIIYELERMRNEPVTTEELELAKRYMMGSFGRSLEDPRTVARFALNTELNNMPTDYYKTYLTRLEGVTVEQVQDAALAFLHPDQAVILVVGDKDATMDLLAPLSQQNNTPVIQLDEDGKRWMEELEEVNDRQPDQVIESYIHAIGGRQPIAAIRQLKLVWTIGDPEDEKTRTVWMGPEQYRMELKQGPRTLEEVIYDGNRAQIFTPEGSGELTDAALEAIKADALPVPEVTYDKLMDRKMIPGSTELNGKKVYKLYMVNMSGIAFSEYFDAETGMKLRRVEDRLIYGRSYNVTTEFGDWRLVNGVLMPHTIYERGGPDGRVTSTLTKVEVNKPFPPGFFEVNIPEVPDEPAEPEWVPPAEKE